MSNCFFTICVLLIYSLYLLSFCMHTLNKLVVQDKYHECLLYWFNLQRQTSRIRFKQTN